ncbi:MAG: hypothetical protein KC591_09435 [Gemmatimonadetes bacterium]|nr:hypothetical protein [Gemmatimonadota bacterium]
MEKNRRLALRRDTVRALNAAAADVRGGKTAPIASVDLCTYYTPQCPPTGDSCVYTECPSQGPNCPNTVDQCV